MEICSLSPSPLWGEGWGEGWLLNPPKSKDRRLRQRLQKLFHSLINTDFNSV
jgi:hypothetical protein